MKTKISYPAGNNDWAWDFKGFKPPIVYNELEDPIFEKFRKYFGEFFGIGDFSYWIISELEKMTVEEENELLDALNKFGGRFKNKG